MNPTPLLLNTLYRLQYTPHTHLSYYTAYTIPYTHIVYPPLTYPLTAKHNTTHQINTFVLIARRNVLLNSTSYHLFNAAFYASWLFFRLLVFPALVMLYTFEYIEFLHDPLGANGAVINVVLLAPVLMGMLTLLGRSSHTL